MCCSNTNPIPAGAQTIQLGTYTPGRQLNIYFTTATGRVDMISVYADKQGIIKFITPQLRLNTPYTITIAETADITQTNMQWLIGSTGLSCITATFMPMAYTDNCFAPDVFEITLVQ